MDRQSDSETEGAHSQTSEDESEVGRKKLIQITILAEEVYSVQNLE